MKSYMAVKDALGVYKDKLVSIRDKYTETVELYNKGTEVSLAYEKKLYEEFLTTWNKIDQDKFKQRVVELQFKPEIKYRKKKGLFWDSEEEYYCKVRKYMTRKDMIKLGEDFGINLSRLNHTQLALRDHGMFYPNYRDIFIIDEPLFTLTQEETNGASVTYSYESEAVRNPLRKQLEKLNSYHNDIEDIVLKLEALPEVVTIELSEKETILLGLSVSDSNES